MVPSETRRAFEFDRPLSAAKPTLCDSPVGAVGCIGQTQEDPSFFLGTMSWDLGVCVVH